MTPYYDHAGITIYCGDSREIVPALEPVDLVFTSPPYAEQRAYTGACQDAWAAVVPAALASIPLADDGQILVNLGLVHREGEVVEYWAELHGAMRTAGRRLFGWYVWDQCYSLPGDWNGRLAPCHEFVFHYNTAAKRPHKTERCIHAGTKHSTTGLRSSDGVSQGWSGGSKPSGETKIHGSVIRDNRATLHDIHGGHPAVFPVSLPARFLTFWGGGSARPVHGLRDDAGRGQERQQARHRHRNRRAVLRNRRQETQPGSDAIRGTENMSSCSGPNGERGEWTRLTGDAECTTRSLCDFARKTLKALVVSS